MTDLTPLIAFRWSPRSFDPAAELGPTEVDLLLEAARWAPSAANRQPWRFALGHRDDDTWKRIMVNLPKREQRWAGRASLLLLAAHLAPAAEPAEETAYDLGQAVAQLTMQATALGLHTRQLRELDRAGLTTELELPADLRPAVVIAIGRLGNPLDLPADLIEAETGLRRRHPVADLLLSNPTATPISESGRSFSDPPPAT
ncbi:nitroreductase family protein [Salinispora fenicalii]|uniref:nitroreductase family protein n=1 Tax=Salinispora fenicalii TaxID=1137263 RepID=UPI0003693196|nr:nitroreductase family protein [Salinispora fenicalii]